MTSHEEKPAAEPPSDRPGSSPRTASSELVPFSNALLFIGFCVLAGTGLALEFRLKYANATLLGVVRRDWVDFHRLVALSFLSLSAIHLWVNLPWLRSMLVRVRWPTLIVMAMGVAILATFLFAPVF